MSQGSGDYTARTLVVQMIYPKESHHIMESKRPSLKLSVVTVAYESAADCHTVIQELRHQTAREVMEVIVVTPSREGIDESDFDDFGAWRWVIYEELQGLGKVMEMGVRVAQAPFVTYAEEHVYFHETWAEHVIAAHEKGYDVVGFAIENANPDTLTSWAHLYGQIGPVVAPVESGESTFLGSHHTSYRTEFLLSYGSLLGEMLEDESALFLDINAKGKPMFLAGNAISRHVNVSNLKTYIQLEYIGQRSFADARARVGKWSWFKRALYIGATPLIPWVRLTRILKHIKRSGRQRELLPQILAPIGLALLAGACGEMLGYLVGGGDSAKRKLPFELQREIYTAKKIAGQRQPPQKLPLSEL